MTSKIANVPLLISRSTTTTETNKTGFWRYLRPEFNEKTCPCSVACPAGEDIARIEKLINQNLFKQALETILIENPFPSVCGRVCFHTCENACNRNEFDESLAIHNIERFLGDEAINNGLAPVIFRFPPNGKKIAIVGAGPAGLSAAYFMTLLGYYCDIFESDSEPGGILRWGIPEYRLPVNILEYEISRIEKTGIKINCGQLVTEDFLKDLYQSHNAVIIGAGLGRTVKMNIPGEEGAIEGLSFLHNMKKGETTSLKGPVAVIGGGNTAVDVSRTLIRLGINPTIIYRRRRSDMPAFQHEVDLAINEGVLLKELFSPVFIEKTSSEYKLVLQKMRADDDLDGKRAKVVPVTDQFEEVYFTKIISAIGAEPSQSWQIPDIHDGEKISLSNCVILSDANPVVFIGDLTNQTKSVTEAIASGKQAAIALDILFSQGKEKINRILDRIKIGNGPFVSMEIYIGGARKKRSSHVVSSNEINADYFKHASRMSPEYISFNEQGNNSPFIENERILSEQDVLKEANRCFNCGVCNSCDNCKLFCPEISVILDNEKGRSINLDYCKGCGICVVECPRNAMRLIAEE